MATPTANFNFPDDSVVFLMVPFPAQSHLNQLLRLSHLIHSRGFPVHYASSVTHCRQVKLRHDSKLTNPPGIVFHELVTPPFNSPPPLPSSSSMKFPDHLWPSFEASLNLSHPVAMLLRELSLSARRLIIIHDNLMTYVVQDSPSVPNSESYSFNCSSSFCTFCLDCLFSGKPLPIEVEPESIPNLANGFTQVILNFFGLQSQFDHIRHGILFNSCRAIEGPYLAKTEETNGKKQWAIAPLFSDHDSKAHPSLKWLDKHPPKSVIYVSFGSTTTMNDEQIKELALGLEQSKQRFLWVLRDSDRGDIFNGTETRILQLPEGYEERVKDVGKVIRDWAPQLGILRHPSVGGFMSHCGWNSCMESMTMGVPLVTWPMHSDQPHNALLITDILKVGVPVIGWGEREQLVVNSCTIKKSVESLMTSNEGHAVRRRVENLGEVIRQSVDHVDWEFNSFIAYATRI